MLGNVVVNKWWILKGFFFLMEAYLCSLSLIILSRMLYALGNVHYKLMEN